MPRATARRLILVVRRMLTTLAGLSVACAVCAGPAGTARQEYDFSQGWKVYIGDAPEAAAPDFDDSSWKRVILPRAINEDEAFKADIKGLSTAHMAEMKALRDRFDPHGGRAIGSREMLDSIVAEYRGEMLYINKSATKPVWAMEYSRDEGARAYQDEWTPPFHQDAPAYNRNQDTRVPFSASLKRRCSGVFDRDSPLIHVIQGRGT